jgi:hypothetical protein
VACVMVHQGVQPSPAWRCPTNATKGTITEILCPTIGRTVAGQPGRCVEAGRRAAYVCEKPGLFGTFSIRERVRYTGVLQDQAGRAGDVDGGPVAFCSSSRASFFRLLPCSPRWSSSASAPTTPCRGAGSSSSRPCLGPTSSKRPWVPTRLVIAAVMAGPLMLLGGRGGGEAEHSALRRLGPRPPGSR